MNKHRIFDETIGLKDNAMLKTKPELFYEWIFEKNDELGLDIYKITHGSDKKVWWKCPDCNSEYRTKVDSRARRNNNCPYCNNFEVNHTNSLATLKPDIAKEWHSIKNGNITPHDRMSSSNKKAWWFSSVCEHEWEATINNRTKENGTGCPYCARRPKLLKGFNDMWATNPEQAKLLNNPEDGFKYTQSSNKRVDWKCLDCGNIIKNKMINDVNQRGLSCPKCSDGISFPEKFMYNLLKESNIDFEFDVTQEWSEGKRYDFSFKFQSKTYIIEVHGLQHYEEGFRTVDKGCTLVKVKENDKHKERLARINGIDGYIVIDCRYSTIEWIKNSILNSELMSILDRNIDFNKIAILATKTFVRTTCELWNSGIQDTNKLAKILGVHKTTVVKYLKRGAEIGWCDYTTHKGLVAKNMKIRN